MRKLFCDKCITEQTELFKFGICTNNKNRDLTFNSNILLEKELCKKCFDNLIKEVKQKFGE